MTSAPTEKTGVKYHVRDGIASITMESHPVNAMSLSMIRAIVANFKHAATDPNTRVVVLKSAIPERFSAGLDLARLISEPTEGPRELLQELYINLFDAQYNLGKPSIAAVNGTTRGGGMTLAISCDMIIASNTATFGYPEIDVGVLPAIHFGHLPRIVGRHRAFELLFSGRAFDAKEAYDLGLISKVVADVKFDDAVTDLAKTFASKSEVITRMAR
ncbi:MAG: enoyl-CoA hydratase/isomerase family protein, partial [Hyphomicrobiaceae bacterium]